MPVKSIERQLDELGTLGNLPRWGKLRKGAEKLPNRAGGDLDHFRLTLETPYAHIMPAFIAKYGEQPKEFRNVYLAADSADQAFKYFREEWAHARLVNRCDEETVFVSWSDGLQAYDTTPHACTCNPADRACGYHGRMDIVLPDLCREIDEWGKITIETGSFYDCVALRSSMRIAQAFAANLPDVAFWSIPFRIGRAIRTVPVTIKGQRSNKPMSLLYASPEKEFNRAVFSPMLIAPTQMLLADKATGELPEVMLEQAAAWDRDYVNEQTLHLFGESGSGAENHQANAIDKMIADGLLTDDMTDTEALQVIVEARAQREAEKQAEPPAKKPRKNASKSNQEAEKPHVAEPQVQGDLDWNKNPGRVGAFIAAADKSFKLNHGQIIQALQWVTDDGTVESIDQFTGTSDQAWVACLLFACRYNADKVMEWIPDATNPNRILALTMLEGMADIPF
jgi:hypothetical protein